MNLYLHGIDADPCPIQSGVDSLAGALEQFQALAGKLGAG